MYLSLFSDSEIKILYCFYYGALYYSQMTINQKINFKSEISLRTFETLETVLRFNNEKLLSFNA